MNEPTPEDLRMAIDNERLAMLVSVADWNADHSEVPTVWSSTELYYWAKELQLYRAKFPGVFTDAARAIIDKAMSTTQDAD